MKEKQDKSISTSLIKALNLIGYMSGKSNYVRLVDIVEGSQLPRTTVIRILQTLQEYGFVSNERQGYRLNEHFYTWASRDRYQQMRLTYRPLLQRISQNVQELVLIGMREGGAIIHLDFVEWDHCVRVAPAPATRHSLEKHALGKLALSLQPGILEKTKNKRLRKELEEIQKTGIAWNRGESDSSMIALATWGFRKTPSEPMIAVAWPQFRFSEESANVAIKSIREIIAEHLGKQMDI